MTLPESVEASIFAHARRAYPEECCGLLLGREVVTSPAAAAAGAPGPDGAIVDAVAIRNVADHPATRYRIDPRDHFAIVRAARQRGLQVVGVYHSHPRSQAVPSETDREEGFRDFLFLIVGLATDPPDLKGWIWSEGNFTLLPLVRVRKGF